MNLPSSPVLAPERAAPLLVEGGRFIMRPWRDRRNPPGIRAARADPFLHEPVQNYDAVRTRQREAKHRFENFRSTALRL